MTKKSLPFFGPTRMFGVKPFYDMTNEEFALLKREMVRSRYRFFAGLFSLPGIFCLILWYACGFK